MKKANLTVVIVSAFLLCACSNEDAIQAESDNRIDLSACEVAFPEKNRTETVINSETIQITGDNDYIFQGDILLSKEQVEDLKTSTTRGGILNGKKYKWTDGIVYYTIASGTSDKTRNMIYSAIQTIEIETVLKFIPRTKHKDYVEFFNGSGCWSMLGKVGGKQQISIDDSWAIRGNVIHEIFHAVGMLHEHSRRDRDKYIHVNYNNIIASQKGQYDITRLNHNVIDTYFGYSAEGMDYGSIMIYSSRGGANAINNSIPVMTKKKDGSTWDAQRNYPSQGDISAIASIYGYKPGGGGGGMIW